jgi:hypothetical protein
MTVLPVLAIANCNKKEVIMVIINIMIAQSVLNIDTVITDRFSTAQSLIQRVGINIAKCKRIL